jgi:hypothetical protein
MIYFLTTHGTLLTNGEAGGPVGHRDLRTVPDASRLFGLDVPIDRLRRDYRGFIENSATPPVEVEAPGLGAVTLEMDAARNVVWLKREGLTASAGPEPGPLNWTASQPDAWEHLLALTETDIGQIIQLAQSNWVVRSSRRRVRGFEVALERGHRLRVGPLSIPLGSNLPFDARQWPFRVNLLIDGWRIEELCLYRPLVYYTSFRAPNVHQQLFLSIRSLLEFGHYDGQVHALTDLPLDALCRGVETLPRDRASVQAIEPDDWAGFVASKYCILEHKPAWQHQPVAYLDPDIVINADINPMLIEMALADAITAPIEDVGPMRTWPSVGASLIQRDGYDPRYARGFNAGTLGIPNLSGHGHTLRQIRRIIANILAADGRDHLEWVDQEVANYVSFRQAHIDTASITRFVRYGAPHDAETPGVLSGLVHFWATPKHDRHRLMERYVDVLRAYAREAHHLN